MIKNERQDQLTKAQANRFSQTLQSLGEADGVHPLIVKAQRETLSSQIADLKEELREYESLKAGLFQLQGSRRGLGYRQLMLHYGRIQ